MNYTLKRFEKNSAGIFSNLSSLGSPKAFATLEPSYLFDHEWISKIPTGIHECVRGIHELKNGVIIETFMVMDPGHSGILFHVGNWPIDSHGCILVGSFKLGNAVFQSKKAFALFLKSQEGCKSFQLEVLDA